MKVKDLKIYFRDQLLGYYPKEELESFFYIASEYYLGFKRVDISLNRDIMINSDNYNRFQDLIERLKNYEPIQYILGETEFFGLKFNVNESVLIPRHETEELIDWIISDNTKLKTQNSINILDIGTGSGCIPVTLAKHLPNAIIYAIDISEEALKIAKQNAKQNKVNVIFKNADVLNDSIFFDGVKFDIIVSNPPYVRRSEKLQMKENVLNYEPHIALFVEDDDPLLFYRHIVELSDKLLKKEGALYFEINEGLANGTKNVMKNRFKNVELRKDINGKDRMIKGIRL